MDDPRAADGVEHLQSAARELLAAARSFLDVVEDVVEDRDRLQGAADTVVGLLRDGVAGVAAAAGTAGAGPAGPSGGSSDLEPWEAAAWGMDTPESEAHDPADPGEPADTDEPESSAASGPGSGDGTADPAGAPRSGGSRVRRISVD